MKKEKKNSPAVGEPNDELPGPLLKKAKKHKDTDPATLASDSKETTKRQQPDGGHEQHGSKRAKMEEKEVQKAVAAEKDSTSTRGKKEKSATSKLPLPKSPAKQQAEKSSGRAERTIFLQGLPKDKTEEEIKKYYSRLAPDAVQKVRCHFKPTKAYVIFKDTHLAEQALALPGPTLRGKLAIVDRFDPTKSKEGKEEGSAPPATSQPPQQKKGSPKDAQEAHKMFVGKCPDSITDSHISDHYAALGDGAIEKVAWIRQDGAFRGYGFVWFRDEETLAAALKLPPPQVDGRTLTVQAAGFTASKHQLFVGGMKGTGKSIVDVQKYFEKRLGAGCITRSRELTERDGTSRGAGFLDFASEEFMNRALGTPRPIFGKYIITVEKTGKAKGAASQPKEAIKDREAVIRKCPAGMTDEDLLRHYDGLGDSAIKNINWTKDRRTAFIVFSSSDFRNKALEMSPPVVDFHVLNVSASTPRG